jgi:plasmid stability protein
VREVTLSLPDDLCEELDRRARASGRSVAEEALAALSARLAGVDIARLAGIDRDEIARSLVTGETLP